MPNLRYVSAAGRETKHSVEGESRGDRGVSGKVPPLLETEGWRRLAERGEGPGVFQAGDSVLEGAEEGSRSLGSRRECAPGERMAILLCLFYILLALWSPGDLPVLRFIY